jgi:DNA-binding LacI/PurR family transcriptional regulator
VLSGSRGVKEASRQAVLQAAEALNYRPNMIAQSLLSQTTGCIGVICAQDNINQTTSYLYALEKQLSQHQMHLLLRFANSRGRVLHSLEELTCGLCDNVLIIGARFPLNIDRPDVVLIDCLESDGTNSIQFDHAFAAETACNYLISQGRRQIALIHPRPAALLTRFCWAISTRWKRIFCRSIATWFFSTAIRRPWRFRSW